VTIAEYIVLALVSALWPTLVAVVIVALATENPKRLLISFLAGGLMTTIGVGLAIVFSLEGTQIVDSSKSKTGPAVDIAVGTLCLVAAFVARRRGLRRPPDREPEKQKSKGPSRTERALARGTLYAFLLGIGLDLLPGFFYLVALKDIAEADYSAGEVVALVVVFCVLMFMLIELPIISFLVAPDKTTDWVHRFNAWLHANAKRLIPVLALAVGIFLIVEGVVALV
jgi:hypothetical protein